MKYNIIRLFISCLFCFVCAQAFCEQIFVANLSEFESSVTSLKVGDELVLKNGVWRDVHLKISAKGSAKNPIIVRAQNQGEVIFSGNSRISLSGENVVLDGFCFRDGSVAYSAKSKAHVVEFRNGRSEAKYCTIKNCSFSDYSPSDKSFDDVWVSLHGESNTVEHCEFSTKDNMGLYIVVWHKAGREDNHIIRNNFFTRPKTYNREQNGQEIIRIGDSHNSLSDSKTIIENNIFYKCNGEIEIISVKSGANIIRSNIFEQCRGAVTLRHGNNNIVEGNYFLANNGGVRVINSGHKIFNNYFYRCTGRANRAAISVQTGVVDTPLNGYHKVRDVVIANNTFVDCELAYSLCVKNSLKLASGQRVPATDEPENVLIYGSLANTSKSTSIDENNSNISGIVFEHCEFDAKPSSECFVVNDRELVKLISQTNIPSLSFVKCDLMKNLRESMSKIGALNK